MNVDQKQMYANLVQEMREMTVKHRLPEDLVASLDKLTSEMESFSVKMPIVGGFNAGKSTLINSFLGTELLPVEITPETC